MFPLSFVFLAVAGFSYGNLWKAIPRVLLSALIFLAIASPFIAAISRAKGRLTFGDSGRWNYVVFVDGVQPLYPQDEALRHRVAKVFDAPVAGSKKLVAGVVVFVAAASCISAAWSTLVSQLDQKDADPVYWNAATALEKRGIRAQDKIALIWTEQWENGLAEGAFVPRLAKVQVVAEVSQPTAFWAASASTRTQILKAFEKTGARAILMRGAPPLSSEPHWERLGQTDYYLYV